MQTSKLSGKFKTFKALSLTVIVIPVLLLAFLFSSELVSNTNAEKVTANLNSGSYYVNISADDVTIRLDTTPSGDMAYAADSITVATNSGTGYRLYLSMNNRDVNGNRLYKDGDSSSPDFLAATANPSLDMNSWGYSVDFNTTTGTGNWNAVPLLGNEALIHSKATKDTTGDTFNLFYGVRANDNVSGGSYSNSVVYTAVADASGSPTGNISAVVTNKTDGSGYASLSGGDTIDITTSFITSVEDIGDVNVKIGGTNCANISTDLSSDSLNITCTTPSKATGGAYDLLVSLPKFDKTYSLASAIVYPDLWYISNMQDMTPLVCANTAKPAARDGSNNILTTVSTNRINYSTSANVIPENVLTDTRDNTTYKVHKFADGNCWMSQDLAITVTSGKTMIASKNDGTTFSYTPASSQVSQKTYRWYEATAGTGTSSQTNTDTTASICPKGWRIPPNHTISTTLSYQGFFVAYGLSDSEAYSVSSSNFSTFASSSGPFNFSETERYWSSTAYRYSSNAYIFFRNSNESKFQVQDWGSKVNNYSIHTRCVAIP